MANESDNPVKVKVLSAGTDGLTTINTATGAATVYPYGQGQVPYPQGTVMPGTGSAAGMPIVMMPPSTPPIILLTVEGNKVEKDKPKPEVSAVFKRI